MDSPLPKMKEDVKKLALAGAEIIAVPCNTAHFFFDELDSFSHVPVLNIVRETAEHIKAKNAKRSAFWQQTEQFFLVHTSVSSSDSALNTPCRANATRKRLWK